MGNDLLNNLDKIKTTELGITRIKRNLGLGDVDVIAWCKDKIRNAKNIFKQGKNWYVEIDGVVITVNSSSYGIITAHKSKGE